MRSTFLDNILAKKRERVFDLKRRVDLVGIREEASELRQNCTPFRLSKALGDRNRINIIAEFKRASPSRGAINGTRDAAAAATAYEAGGAAAISVLTEEDHFQGSLEDLRRFRRVTGLPLLRKDFFFDEFQVYESALAGADAILAIVAALSPEDLLALLSTANGIGLDVIVEVHDKEELEIARAAGAGIIGVNNRDLKTFAVSLEVSREIIRRKDDTELMIAESGITGPDDVMELSDLGFDGFLIGEALMRSNDPLGMLKEFGRFHPGEVHGK